MRFGKAYVLLLAFLGASALLALDIGEHMITGFVREEGSSTPIAAATLEISGPGSQGTPSVISGTDGEFVFRGLQEGDYVITAKKTGFDSASINVAVRRTGVPQVTISLRRTAAAGAGEPGGAVSAHQLEAPKKARGAYEKGLRLLENENNP